MTEDTKLNANLVFLGQQISRLANVLQDKANSNTQLMFGQASPNLSKLIDVLAEATVAQRITDEEVALAIRDLVEIFKLRNLSD